MKNYKVQIIKTYCIDVKAEENNAELIQRAENILDKNMLNGTEHYMQTGDTDFMVFDVTGTDDARQAEIYKGMKLDKYGLHDDTLPEKATEDAPQDTCDGKHDNVQAIVDCEVCTNSSLLN